jgi:hypothetical protein
VNIAQLELCAVAIKNFNDASNLERLMARQSFDLPSYRFSIKSSTNRESLIQVTSQIRKVVKANEIIDIEYLDMEHS